ncbi:hypothetical protein KY290_016266 [Solanum tuberosum]|uniref:Aldehyde dehydrogenase domain-containing protein n=1 Tax=Solanum tuberosum TaxID=4113 RepID=A0ABQ7VUS9_SOLTU|nr:hypothetical protein KY285_014959 [Solanum tuberosum]KAH0772285.1 hypothetical protein KY290_016266 [Solanum tuberosum]
MNPTTKAETNVNRPKSSTFLYCNSNHIASNCRKPNEIVLCWVLRKLILCLFFYHNGRYSNYWKKGIRRFCSSAVVHEEPITPPVEVKYNQLLINGQFVDAASGKTFPTFDPRTGEAITTVAEANTEDVNRAVSAARKAFDEGPWPKMTAYTLHEPIGVAGQIILWNFPLLMFTWKVGPALACGNTVVLKPAEQTPLSALYVSKLFHEVFQIYKWKLFHNYCSSTRRFLRLYKMIACNLCFTPSVRLDFLPGVLNVIPGSGSAGADLASHMDVDKGQSCCAGSRTFVHERVYDEFVEKAKVRALKLIVGDPFKKGVEQGPQIDTEQFEKILKYIKSGEKLGSKGFYVQPTVFSNVQDNMLIARDEIFGPVQSLLKFKDVEEVIRRANSSHYGLAAAGGRCFYPEYRCNQHNISSP